MGGLALLLFFGRFLKVWRILCKHAPAKRDTCRRETCQAGCTE